MAVYDPDQGLECWLNTGKEPIAQIIEGADDKLERWKERGCEGVGEDGRGVQVHSWSWTGAQVFDRH